MGLRRSFSQLELKENLNTAEELDELAKLERYRSRFKYDVKKRMGDDAMIIEYRLKKDGKIIHIFDAIVLTSPPTIKDFDLPEDATIYNTDEEFIVDY